MEPNGRESFEAPVREFEDRVLGYAVALVKDRARAEQIVEQAFAVVLTAPDRGRSLEARLCAATRKLAGGKVSGSSISEHPRTDLRVSRDLHLRILDAVEDRQYTTRPARSRLIALGVAVAIVAIAGAVEVQRTRSAALAAAAPTITDLTPQDGATEVPVGGQFRVQFARRPVGTPTLSAEPSHGSLHVASWDGSTLLVDYSGLRFGVRYQLAVDAQYQSHLHDTGHFQQRWTFRSEAPPKFVGTAPDDGAVLVPRSGQLTVQLSKRPPVEPVVGIDSPDATFKPGAWSGATWVVDYSGLRPLTRYRAHVAVRTPDPSGRIDRTWTFTVEPGPPPDGIPVIWYSTVSPWQPPGSSTLRLIAVDWTGALVGTLYLSGPVSQSPDGSRLDGNDQVVNQRGTGLATSVSRGGGLWSDDSRHRCSLGDSSGSDQIAQPGQRLWLYYGTIGEASRRIAVAGTATEHSYPSIIACSSLSNRAVVGDQTMGGMLGIRVIDLSTGRTLYQHVYPGDQSAMVVSSHDGRYLAEQSWFNSHAGSGPTMTTSIRRIPDSAIVGRIAGRRINGFSWDGSRVVTSPEFPKSGGDVQLLDWQRNAILMRLPFGDTTPGLALLIPQPNGPDFMLGMSAAGNGTVDGLWLVHPDGRSSKVVEGGIYPTVPLAP